MMMLPHPGPAIRRPEPTGSNGPLNFAQKFHPCHYQIPFFKIKIEGSLPHAPAPLPANASSCAAPGHCQVGPTMQQPPPPAPAAASTSSAPAPQSLVSRARTAIHSAAARVLTDIKADLRDADGSGGRSRAPSPRTSLDREVDLGATGRELDVKPPSPRDECFQVLELSPSGNVDSSSIATESISSAKLPTVPPTSTVKQLVAAIEHGKNFKSMSHMRATGDQFLKDKGGLSLSVVKSLVRRDKEERSSSEFFGDDETQSLMYSLFKLEEQFPLDGSQCNPELIHSRSLSKDLHGAPPGSFIHHLAVVIGSISSVHKMAFFWQSVVLELRKLWSDWQPVPRMPLDAPPDLNSCLLHQEMQVINCCIARKKRRKAAKESLDSLLKQANIDNSEPRFSNGKSPDSEVCARDSTGDYVLRLGADRASENLTLLETGELIYAPTLQEGPIMTAELIKETEELVLRTGSLGAGCSQLLSDMQAFKAANPGCVLEDFVRWHSPPDWSEDCAANSTTVGEGSSRRGRLSDRMQTKGNLWKELWETAKPIPAVEQTPIYDEDLAVESIFDALEVIEPSKLFEQLLAVTLSVCFVAAELVLTADSNLSKLFYDCKDYIIGIYQDDMSKDKLDEICKVYETMEAIVTHPEEALQIMEQPDEKSIENKNRFKLKLNFMTKDRPPLWKRTSKDEKKMSPKDDKSTSEEKNTKIFSNLFDKKVNIFSKKNAKSLEVPVAPPSTSQGPFDESEWTIL
ncbi:rab3 GTPase-activating protein catalytic subunit isoform X2 [Setaria italica]|uniref:rab3 GTPase-activating protein catalytic subunit isoform X2 n=1 Tax=Setaria italica TaxID=4555 RepID=UPI000350A556|nr:rab3 GTPase-activating protein catalytic subunit isoform X2 [Setaria italica]